MAFELYELFEYLSNICKNSEKPIVLIIDEVDNATNNKVFLDFLAKLRRYYLNRDEIPTFWSVMSCFMIWQMACVNIESLF